MLRMGLSIPEEERATLGAQHPRLYIKVLGWLIPLGSSSPEPEFALSNSVILQQFVD